MLIAEALHNHAMNWLASSECNCLVCNRNEWVALHSGICRAH